MNRFAIEPLPWVVIFRWKIICATLRAVQIIFPLRFKAVVHSLLSLVSYQCESV